ncbi:MAG: hypothetical protein LQ346_006980 [Caloplaca aetnensis]|nr:MAG: hypothetical protein LQ346_006980 [Caloplaca aetnensis]
MVAKGAPATRTWTPEDLKKNGWSTYSDANSVSPDLLPALDGLGVPHAPGDIRPVFANHYDGFADKSGKKVPATQGFYHNKYIPGSPGKGAILSEAKFSPAFQREKAGSKEAVPEMNRWSDIVWLLWAQEAGDKAGNLRFIFRDKVRNDVTREIIERIHGLQENPDTLDLPWPGHKYDMRTDDGKALLGSPQGIGVAYLIKDHSNVVGRKIPYAHVFSVDNRPPSLSGSEGGDSSDSDDGSGNDSGSSSSSSGSGSSSSAASGGPPVYNWDYYIVWELRDRATG